RVGEQLGHEELRLRPAHRVETGVAGEERPHFGGGAGTEREHTGLDHRVGTVRVQRFSEISSKSPSRSDPASGTSPGRLPPRDAPPSAKRASIRISAPSETRPVDTSEMKTRAFSTVVSSAPAAARTETMKMRDIATDGRVGSSRMETASPVKPKPLPPP